MATSWRLRSQTAIAGRGVVVEALAFSLLFICSGGASAQPTNSREPLPVTQAVAVNFSDLAVQEAQAGGASEAEPGEIPFMPIPGELPVPPGPARPRTQTAPGVAATNPAAAPRPVFSFPALGDDNTYIPPDTHGAVGPAHVMVTLNTQVRIQNRTGRETSTVSLRGFWSALSLPSSNQIFDPRVAYDPFAGRWIVTAVAKDVTNSTSKLLIGVSRNADPSGSWYLCFIDTDPAHLVWADYPTTGFNKTWIVVQTNMFDFATPEPNFVRSNIYVFDKASLYAGISGLSSVFQSCGVGGTQVPSATVAGDVNTRKSGAVAEA
jgi:hypothetical protein